MSRFSRTFVLLIIRNSFDYHPSCFLSCADLDLGMSRLGQSWAVHTWTWTCLSLAVLGVGNSERGQSWTWACLDLGSPKLDNPEFGQIIDFDTFFAHG